MSHHTLIDVEQPLIDLIGKKRFKQYERAKIKDLTDWSETFWDAVHKTCKKKLSNLEIYMDESHVRIYIDGDDEPLCSVPWKDVNDMRAEQ